LKGAEMNEGQEVKEKKKEQGVQKEAQSV